MRIQAIISRLTRQNLQFALYYNRKNQIQIYESNAARFPAASIIKIPLLLTWARLERQGVLHRSEMCNLDSEAQVQGAGFSWLLSGRSLPYHDILMMMIALSDNLCTNLVIRRIGLERAARVIQEDLGLKNTVLQRKLMDFEARDRGLDNWIDARDCVQYYALFDQLAPDEKAWIEPMLLVNQDDALLKRNIPRDILDFYHKTGSMGGVLHDWGYTRDAQIFLLTSSVQNEPAVFDIFGKFGRLLLEG